MFSQAHIFCHFKTSIEAVNVKKIIIDTAPHTNKCFSKDVYGLTLICTVLLVLVFALLLFAYELSLDRPVWLLTATAAC